MDYIREFDIRLEKEMYYAGELLSGLVILDTSENFKLRAIRVNLRGKAHTEWKVIISGDRRTVKDDQHFIDDRSVIWGKEKAKGSVPILPRGKHQFPFRFQLPETSLPCSFESKCGTIRYYLKVTIDIPYASPPQGVKYFTIIGPHIDCMDDNFLKPIRGEAKRKTCCLCCERRIVSLSTQLDRSAYCCGESLRVKADIDNQSEEEARLKLKLVQHVEYFIDKGVLGVEKEVTHTILEYRSAAVKPHTRTKWDSQHSLVVSTMPPSLVGICRLIQIYYVLKAHLEFEKSGEDLHMNFPITIGTVPFRIPNSKQKPKIQYDVASDHVAGGMYIGPEFQLGQVYDGTVEFGESIVLYRPVYITVVPASLTSSSSTAPTAGSSSGSALKSSMKSKPHKSSMRQTPSAAAAVRSSGNPPPVASSSSHSSKKQGDAPVISERSSKSKPHRSSEKASKVHKLNALAVVPPSLQSIAKKRSSLPDTKPYALDSLKPFSRFEFSSFKKDEKKKSIDKIYIESSASRTKIDETVDISPQQPCTSAQALQQQQQKSSTAEKNQLETNDNGCSNKTEEETPSGGATGDESEEKY